ncbi:PREDICTED: uncharacterized protein LOC109582648 [Amphimedon queenslandica]|uniref:Tc1-like transposase DDE domain-containing protein n=1 Tax=Amphimedon queenslandica TaxID=400682 RepID=A0AAN0J8L5_AMPQE|nr:PREDICTED: uncharacterized protein LOC109582648 [Amphimedon queenslandica]|eukprot:XP_019853048.1 PREDICTED: uncharacterized protein LOC109582648 [Amphimedon queenslandica]
MVIEVQQRCEFLRILHFVDNTGADGRDSMRKLAYSLKRKLAVATKLLVTGNCVSANVGMSQNGIIDFYATTPTVNNDTFLKFVQDCFIFLLKPFNGINNHSTVVLDNSSIYNVDNVVDAIQSTGVLVQFLPPYSPDINQIENAFTCIKSSLKITKILGKTWILKLK